MIDLDMLAVSFDGALVHASKIRIGLLGTVDKPHGHPDRWNWGRTRFTLHYAMQGFVVRPRSAVPSIEEQSAQIAAIGMTPDAFAPNAEISR